MRYYYITGASRGIGRALAERLLATQADAEVIGVGRTSSIEHARYRHLPLDLRDMAAVQAFTFPAHSHASRVVLVNNAGTLTVKPLGRAPGQAIIDDYLVSLVAPTLLMNSFLAAYQDLAGDVQVVNISSGAAALPTDGWAVYCASKAGIDLLSRSVALEQQVAGGRVRVLSIAPGVADTEMQGVIRASDPADFSRQAEFVGFKQSGALADPAVIAQKLCKVMDDRSLGMGVLLSLRNVAL